MQIEEKLDDLDIRAENQQRQGVVPVGSKLARLQRTAVNRDTEAVLYALRHGGDVGLKMKLLLV